MALQSRNSDENEKKNENTMNMQTRSKLTGTQSQKIQKTLENEELQELKKQNKLVIKYISEMKEQQDLREKELQAIKSSL
ncbi:DUF334 domain-containing protein, partial [Bacillus thuringiensis]|nr:DUF334 domain-containing protein [Bacillus thuringiensis]